MSESANPHLRTGAPRRWGEPNAPIAVLGLHGRGGSPADIGHLRERVGDTEAVWLAPAAADGVWYPYRFMAPQPEGDPWLAWSFEAVAAGLEHVRDLGVPAERTVLLGFSQGACLLAEWVLRRPVRFAGLALLTGGHLGPEGTRLPPGSGFDGTPALTATVEDDGWVPLARVRETEAALRSAGARVTALVEPGAEHGVTDAAVGLLQRLLRTALPPR